MVSRVLIFAAYYIQKYMPESLACKISLSFIPIIFVEGHIMNSPFVAIVPLYALVVWRTVMWRRYQFTNFTRFKGVLS